MDVAVGCIAGPLERLRTCFEATPSWSAFTGTVAATHKLFHFNIVDDKQDAQAFSMAETVATRPFVYLYPDYPQGFVMQSDADGGSSRSGGTIQVLLEKNRDDLNAEGDRTDEEIARRWDNLVGTMLRELFCVAWDQEILDVRQIDSVQLMTPTDIDQHGKGEYVKAAFKIHWGQVA